MNKTINLFISQPMSGLSSDEIQKERDRIIDNYCLQCDYNRDDIIVVNQIEYNELCSDERHGPLTFLGLSIQRLAIADVVIFHKDWEKARGCVIEHSIVHGYSKDYKWVILYDYDYDTLGLSVLEPLNGRTIDKTYSKEIEDEYYRQMDKIIEKEDEEFNSVAAKLKRAQLHIMVLMKENRELKSELRKLDKKYCDALRKAGTYKKLLEETGGVEKI